MVLGDESFVGAHAVIKSGVKVYPFKTVEAGATVNTSIVWESRGARARSSKAPLHHRPPITSTSAPELVIEPVHGDGRATLEEVEHHHRLP